MSESAKLTISLPRNLISFADMLAKEGNTSRSGAIAIVLQELAEERERAAMIEGYKAMAAENSRLAEESLPVALEEWPLWEA